ncbi:MAG: DUF4124 domain-containing protein [Kangiellaceae bacterium]|nr:DUF4124 domain-containing protein [Kangiellaceae bacterium]
MKFLLMNAFVVSVFALFLGGGVSAGEIYRWVDENGKVHYSDKKVEGINQSEVELNLKKSSWTGFDIEVNVFDTNLPAEDIERIETDVNNVYRFYDRVLYFDIYKTVPVRITVLANKRKYDEYTKTKFGAKFGYSTVGMYSHRFNEIAIYVRKSKEGFFRTIKHEASHAIVASLVPFIPKWLNEGIAENMETVYLEGDRLAVAHHSGNYRKVSHSDSRVKQVKAFLSMPSRNWNKQNASSSSMAYAQAGEMVRLFLSSQHGLSFITRLIHAYKRGDKRFASVIAGEHYVGGLQVMQNHWDVWRERKQVGAVKF